MNKILSIIIPTYNMESYLNKCLDSLLIGDLMKYLEVLVINDGSKDKSSSIAHNYQDKYPSIKVIDKINGNYGSCVNYGLKIATGKYIKLLDADDYFSQDILIELIKTLINYNIDVDLIITDYLTVNSNGEKISVSNYEFPIKTSFNFIDFFQKKQKNIPFINMHIVAYKRENIIKLNYKQTEGISYTDVEWTFLPITTVQTAFYLNQPLYNYLLGREGQTMNQNNVIRNINSLKTLSLSLIKNYTNSYIKNDLYQQYLRYRILLELIRIYKIYLIFKQKDYKELIDFDKQIEQTNKEIYDSLENFTINKYLKYIRVWRRFKYNKAIYPFLAYNLKINQLIHNDKQF